MNMFEEIEKVKVDLPKVNHITNEARKVSLNCYQYLAIIIFILFVVSGIILGNLFPICGSSGSLFDGVCLTNQFNTALMIIIWFVGFIISLFIFMMGHIILLLTKLNNNSN